MCNLSTGIYEQGMERGMEQGMERGMERGIEKNRWRQHFLCSKRIFPSI